MDQNVFVVNNKERVEKVELVYMSADCMLVIYTSL